MQLLGTGLLNSATKTFKVPGDGLPTCAMYRHNYGPAKTKDKLQHLTGVFGAKCPVLTDAGTAESGNPPSQARACLVGLHALLDHVKKPDEIPT